MTFVPFRVERWMSTYEQDVALNLGESGVQQLRLGELLAMAEQAGHADIRRRLDDLVLTYDETPGSLDLRRRLAALYGVDAGEVLVTQGAIEANYLLLRTLIEPGDVVVSLFPAYQQLYSLAEMCGAEVRRWSLRAEDGFAPDLDALRGLLDERVRLIVLNTPHNPTGAYLDEPALRTILTWAEELDAFVLCDETYHGVTLDDGVRLPPPARALSPRGISVSTLSKTMGLAGLRVGWIAAQPEMVERCWAYRDYVTISCSRLSDVLACLALDLRPALLERCRKLARRNLGHLTAWMSEYADEFDWIPPRAGLLCFPRLRRHTDSRAFCRGLVESESLLLVPGWAFESEGHVRIGLGEGPDVFAAGLERLGRYLRALASR